MASEHFELRIPIKKLLIGLALTVVPISIAGLYALYHSQASLEKMIGTYFQSTAELASAEVSEFVHDRVTSAVALTFDPVLQDAARSANQAYRGLNEQAIEARINQTEKSWNTPAAAAQVERILASPASRLLRRYRELDRRFLRITVTDEKGGVIAATHKTLDYAQADEEFWQAIYAQGRGAVNLTDILYDDVTKSHYIGVGVPILEEGTNRFVGAVDALLEISSVFPVVNRVHLGTGSRALLVKEDGTVISGPGMNLAMKLKSEEHAAVLDAFAASGPRAAGYQVSELKARGMNLIGFADTGLKKDYGSLGWMVLVAQGTSEAFSPIRLVGRLLSFMVLIGLAMVLFLAVYFSLHRTRAYTDIDELAHPPRTASA